LKQDLQSKIKKEHKYLATKEDIMAVKEDQMNVKENVVKFREEMIKQYRSFLTFNITIFAIITSFLIYLVAKS